jgi:isopropylmalate/homocitrate/citramalate synthase
MPLFDAMPRRVTVVEVGPRDGLQDEARPVPAADKVRLVEMLAAAGLPVVEATSFVSPRAVPQLADADEVLPAVRRRPGVRYPVLVPNLRGLERAEAAGADAIAVFTASTETFARRNIGMTIAESLRAFAPVLERARAHGMWTRGYVSTAFGCPYEGAVAPDAPARVASALAGLGVDEVSIGDTVGVADPVAVERVVAACTERVARERLALHLHDTQGRALANVTVGLQLGIETFDAAAGGLGGCPYAPGAPGNLATERLVAMLDAMGVETGVDAAAVAAAGAFARAAVGRPAADGTGRVDGCPTSPATSPAATSRSGATSR